MTFKTGEQRHNSKLTDKLVLEMKELHKKGVSYMKMKKLYGFSHATIHSAVIGDTWKHLKEKYES